MRDQIERITPSGLPVFDAAQDQRAAVAAREGADFGAAQPARGNDSGVERARCIVPGDLAGKGETQISDVLGLVAPVVDADQRVWDKVVARLFEHFADHRLTQRLAAFEVTGRLVEADAL